MLSGERARFELRVPNATPSGVDVSASSSAEELALASAAPGRDAGDLGAPQSARFFKFLERRARGSNSAFDWPVPAAGSPGAWIRRLSSSWSVNVVFTHAGATSLPVGSTRSSGSSSSRASCSPVRTQCSLRATRSKGRCLVERQRRPLCTGRLRPRTSRIGRRPAVSIAQGYRLNPQRGAKRCQLCGVVGAVAIEQASALRIALPRQQRDRVHRQVPTPSLAEVETLGDALIGS